MDVAFALPSNKDHGWETLFVVTLRRDYQVQPIGLNGVHAVTLPLQWSPAHCDMSGVKHNRPFSKMRYLFAIFVLALGLVTQGSRAQAETLVIFAAASLGGALDSVLEGWDGAPVVVSYASSALLARQIEARAPADLFISANEDWMSYLTERGLTRTDSTQTLLTNRLVLAAPNGTAQSGADLMASLAALPEDARIATGLIQSVPAGIYARQTLDHLDLLEGYLPRLVQTENVRVALALVARGEVARAFVYQSDALAEPAVSTEATVPSALHDPIRYPISILATSTHPEVEGLLAFLTSPEAMTRFATFGFEAPE